MTKYDELLKRIAFIFAEKEGHPPEQDLGMGKLRWQLYIPHAAAAITELEADLAKKNEELEYARAGIGYAEAAKLLETIDSLTADLASALEALKPFAEYEMMLGGWKNKYGFDKPPHSNHLPVLRDQVPYDEKTMQVRQIFWADFRRAAAELAKHK